MLATLNLDEGDKTGMRVMALDGAHDMLQA